jgi:hypothetical protein
MAACCSGHGLAATGDHDLLAVWGLAEDACELLIGLAR